MTEIKWRDSKNVLHSCAKESYDKIYKQAVKEIKSARDHDKEKRVDEIQGDANQETIDKEKQKKLESYKAELREMDDDELQEVLESLRAELDDLKNKNKEDTNKDSRAASRREMIGLNNEASQPRYSVLMLDTHTTNGTNGDELLQRMGSRD